MLSWHATLDLATRHSEIDEWTTTHINIQSAHNLNDLGLGKNQWKGEKYGCEGATSKQILK